MPRETRSREAQRRRLFAFLRRMWPLGRVRLWVHWRQSLAHADCTLWLWTTNAHHRDAYAVLDAWGFEHKTTLTWFKDKMGVGHWLRGQTEHCLMAVRGHPLVELTNQTTALFGRSGRIPRSRKRFTSLSSASVPRRAMPVYFPETAGRVGICTVMRPIVPWGALRPARLVTSGGLQDDR